MKRIKLVKIVFQFQILLLLFSRHQKREYLYYLVAFEQMLLIRSPQDSGSIRGNFFDSDGVKIDTLQGKNIKKQFKKPETIQ